ncbi:MAG: 50S ribosomal protein L1 [Chloroflexota bacterium]
MTVHGKKYRQAVTAVETDKLYTPGEAIDAVKKASYAAFDETVELHMKMGLNPRSADQQVRGVALLPGGLGKEVRVLVFAQGPAGKTAMDAGADYVGTDDLVKQIEGGWLEFDVAMATPDMMPKVAKLGKILGRRGLMPNPKSGTVVQAEDLPRAISEARKGRAEFRLDRTAIIHMPIGKVSFEPERIHENLAAVIDAIVKAKPSGAKGQYIRSITLASTMGPGIRLDMKSAMALAE